MTMICLKNVTSRRTHQCISKSYGCLLFHSSYSMSGFTFHKSELQHDNTKQYYYFFSIISREVSVKTLPETFKLDRLETGRGRKCRSLPKVCGPTVPTRDLLALSNLHRPSAAHGSNSCFFTIMQTAGRQVRCDKVAQVL